MDDLQPYINAIKNYFDARIDFAGQEQTEKLARSIIWSFTGIAFIVGFFAQSLRITFGIFSAGVVLTLVLILPAYPAYNSHPVKWLPKLGGSEAVVSKESQGTAQDVERKKDK
ncbi:signal peptidase complex subunit 1, partial [Phenoliferia sp. Uapishka_3]